MKINCDFKAQLLSTSSTQAKNGNMYYSATIFCPESGEAGQLNISEDLFKSLVIGSSYKFTAEWNDKYTSFRVIGAADV